MTAVHPGQAARHPAAEPVVFWHTGGTLDVVAAAQDVAR
jgi:hypothetical protein